MVLEIEFLRNMNPKYLFISLCAERITNEREPASKFA